MMEIEDLETIVSSLSKRVEDLESIIAGLVKEESGGRLRRNMTRELIIAKLPTLMAEGMAPKISELADLLGVSYNVAYNNVMKLSDDDMLYFCPVRDLKYDRVLHKDDERVRSLINDTRNTVHVRSCLDIHARRPYLPSDGSTLSQDGAGSRGNVTRRLMGNPEPGRTPWAAP